MRMQAVIVIQPYMRKNLTPRTLLPFPWDAECTTAYGEKVEYISREYALQRFEQMLEKLAKAKARRNTMGLCPLCLRGQYLKI